MRETHRIGPYEVEARLAQGGMGVVYRARDPALGRRLAIKVLPPQALLSEPARARFRREAEALAQVPHPHVVRVHAAGEDDGQPWIALDLIEGESLGDRVRRGPLEPRTAATIAAQLAGALAHVHQAGILHRDVKPDNVLLDAEGRPLLTDFGLARRLDGDLTRLSASGTMTGTPGFMAPEQVRGDRELDGSVDVYGLGGVLYAMLTGRPPFEGTPYELALAALAAPPAPPSAHRPGLAPALDAICLRCLAKRPADRPTARGLERELGRYLDGTWRAPPPRWALPAALAVLGLGLLLALARPAAPIAGPPTTNGPASTLPASASAAAPAADPGAALQALRRRTDAGVLPELSAWLAAHPEHPLADDARALRQRALMRPLWTGRLAPTLRDPSTQDTCLRWWGDDRLLVWLRLGPGLEVWDVNARRVTQRIRPPAPVVSVLPLDPRRVVLGLSDGRLCWVVDGEVDRVVDAFVPADDTSLRAWGIQVEDLAPTADGLGVWAASQSGLIRSFALDSGARRRELRHGEPVRRLLRVGPDRLISAAGLSVSLRRREGVDPTATNSLRVWDLTTGAPLQTTPLGWSPNALARAGDLVMVANVNREVRAFRFDGDALHPRAYLAGEGVPEREDGFLQGRQALAGQLQDMTTARGLVYAIGGALDDGELRGWQLSSGRQVLSWTLPQHGTSVALQGGRLALGLADGRLQLHVDPGTE